jgi:anhydro-N-acetylmuramic acid kinase
LHEEFGLPSLGREAVYFALMGYEALHGRPNTVPSCTGATHPVVMGKHVPGTNYRELMARVAMTQMRSPRRLIVLGG